MKRKRYSDEQIAFALRQAEGGTAVEEICRKLGVAEATFYRWKKQFAGMGTVEIRRLKQLEEENIKLKRLVADLSLDKTMLQDVLRRKWRGPALGVMWSPCSGAPTRSATDGPARQWLSPFGAALPIAPRPTDGATDAAEGPGRRAGALRLPASVRAAAAGGVGCEPQVRSSALCRGGVVDPNQTAAAQAGVADPAGTRRGRRS